MYSPHLILIISVFFPLNFVWSHLAGVVVVFYCTKREYKHYCYRLAVLYPLTWMWQLFSFAISIFDMNESLMSWPLLCLSRMYNIWLYTYPHMCLLYIPFLIWKMSHRKPHFFRKIIKHCVAFNSNGTG